MAHHTKNVTFVTQRPNMLSPAEEKSVALWLDCRPIHVQDGLSKIKRFIHIPFSSLLNSFVVTAASRTLQ